MLLKANAKGDRKEGIGAEEKGKREGKGKRERGIGAEGKGKRERE